MTKIVPTGDNIVVSPVTISSASGIIIPDTASKEKPMKGQVLAVGPGKLTPEGNRLEMDVKEGDIVLFSKYGPTEVKVDNKDLLVISSSDVLAKLID